VKKLKKTNKLFYDRYIYKIAFETPFARSFRYSNAENIADTIKHNLKVNFDKTKGFLTFEIGWNTKTVSKKEAEDALFIAEQLASLPKDQYAIRVEATTLGFYTSDESVVAKIEDSDLKNIIMICKPENDKIKEFLSSTTKKIIIKEYTHKYKVTINSLFSNAKSFKEWAEKIPKIKLCPKNDYAYESYFYVADEKTLSLCRLFLGSKIRRIDELVTENEI
jgi:hypothetical protein